MATLSGGLHVSNGDRRIAAWRFIRQNTVYGILP